MSVSLCVSLCCGGNEGRGQGIQSEENGQESCPIMTMSLLLDITIQAVLTIREMLAYILRSGPIMGRPSHTDRMSTCFKFITTGCI